MHFQAPIVFCKVGIPFSDSILDLSERNNCLNFRLADIWPVGSPNPLIAETHSMLVQPDLVSPLFMYDFRITRGQ